MSPAFIVSHGETQQVFDTWGGEPATGAPAPMRAPVADGLDDPTPEDQTPGPLGDLFVEVGHLDLSWQADGKCAETDDDGNATYNADMFFLEGRFERNSRDYKQAAKKAKAVCDSCTQKQTCLQFAIDQKIVDGIWGGLTYWERRALRYPRRRVDGKLTYIKGDTTDE